MSVFKEDSRVKCIWGGDGMKYEGLMGTVLAVGHHTIRVRLDGHSGSETWNQTSFVLWGPQPGDTVVKSSNPKDAIAGNKVDLSLLSPIAQAHWAMAQKLGAIKYDPWNFVEVGARASVYIAAGARHRQRWFLGEVYDKDGQHNLGASIACDAILIECEARGNLVDDRPAAFDMDTLYGQLEKDSALMQEKFKGFKSRKNG